MHFEIDHSYSWQKQESCWGMSTGQRDHNPYDGQVRLEHSARKINAHADTNGSNNACCSRVAKVIIPPEWGYWQKEREINSKPKSLLKRCSSPYSDGECSFMTSMASAECAMAAPALISAATQMASMISFSVAPF